MYCDVCQTRKEKIGPRICPKCAKFMCLECENQHCHVFGSGDDDGEHPVADLVEMITYFEGECLRNSTTNKNFEADLSCDECDDGSCPLCAKNLRQRVRSENLMKYAPQIQDALAGCQPMLLSKEKDIRKTLIELSSEEAYLQQEMLTTEETIHKATNELLFRVAAALRRREALLRKSCVAPFLEKLQQIQGMRENAQVFMKVIHRVRDVIGQLAKFGGVPLNKKTFSYLGIMNKIDPSFMRKKKTSKKRLKAPKFSTPPEKELSKLCESMLHINDTKDLHHASVGKSHKRDYLQGEADDELTIGETDEDFGTFHLTGNPHYISRRMPVKKYQGRVTTANHNHVTSNDQLIYKASAHPGTRSPVKPVPKPRGSKLDSLHGKQLSKSSEDMRTLHQQEVFDNSAVTHNHINDADRHREQRRDQQLFQPSGQSNKSSSMTQKKLRFVDNVEEKKYVDSGFPVQGSASVLQEMSYRTNGGLRSRSTGNIRDLDPAMKSNHAGAASISKKEDTGYANEDNRNYAALMRKFPNESEKRSFMATLSNQENSHKAKSETHEEEKSSFQKPSGRGSSHLFDVHESYGISYGRRGLQSNLQRTGYSRDMEPGKVRRQAFPSHLGPNKNYNSLNRQNALGRHLKSTPL